MSVLTRTQMKMLGIYKKKIKKVNTIFIEISPGKRTWVFVNGKLVLKEK